jgi:hypothetical protein
MDTVFLMRIGNRQARSQGSHRRPPRRFAVRAAGPLRVDRQSQDRQGDRAHAPAKAIGLILPDTFVLLADEVIE